ncbi:MAG: 50S ribosomal protein L11 methyltransferase [Xanthobacteraceae bacterium]
MTASETTLATLITDEQLARRIAAVFAEGFLADEVAVSFVDIGGDGWRLSLDFRGAPDEDVVRALVAQAGGADTGRALQFEQIAAKDWVRESLRGLRPIAAGRFVVHGAHDRALVPHNKVGIEIEAGLAFGTGHHATTRGCLLALDALCKSSSRRRGRIPPCPPRRIVDLGTGSGVLAIAAGRALRRPILATDIDANAVRIARDNVRLNRSGGTIRVCRANGVAAPVIRQRAPFDLAFANILLGPLQRLAAPLSRLIAPGGRVVLSGVLQSQAKVALAAYHELTLERRIVLDGWTTLVLKRPAVARRKRRP